jgi:hypothetical protein
MLAVVAVLRNTIVARKTAAVEDIRHTEAAPDMRGLRQAVAYKGKMAQAVDTAAE